MHLKANFTMANLASSLTLSWTIYEGCGDALTKTRTGNPNLWRFFLLSQATCLHAACAHLALKLAIGDVPNLVIYLDQLGKRPLVRFHAS